MSLIFLDTNLIIYLYSEDEPQKRQAIMEYVQSNNIIISIQVINELSNVLYKKFHLLPDKILKVIEELDSEFQIVNICVETIKKAHFIKDKYKYSYYDSLIIATALENNCKILLTEDMKHGQLIENKLIIKNPFKK